MAADAAIDRPPDPPARRSRTRDTSSVRSPMPMLRERIFTSSSGRGGRRPPAPVLAQVWRSALTHAGEHSPARPAVGPQRPAGPDRDRLGAVSGHVGGPDLKIRRPVGARDDLTDAGGRHLAHHMAAFTSPEPSQSGGDLAKKAVVIAVIVSGEPGHGEPLGRRRGSHGSRAKRRALPTHTQRDRVCVGPRHTQPGVNRYSCATAAASPSPASRARSAATKAWPTRLSCCVCGQSLPHTSRFAAR
jgi:hypothetical protein